MIAIAERKGKINNIWESMVSILFEMVLRHQAVAGRRSPVAVSIRDHLVRTSATRARARSQAEEGGNEINLFSVAGKTKTVRRCADDETGARADAAPDRIAEEIPHSKMTLFIEQYL